MAVVKLTPIALLTDTEDSIVASLKYRRKSDFRVLKYKPKKVTEKKLFIQNPIFHLTKFVIPLLSAQNNFLKSKIEGKKVTKS